MNQLSAERRAKVISALVEGNSIRATCRMTGTAKGTVTRLLAELGKACYTYQYRTLRDLECERIPETRYSPGECIGAQKLRIQGDPDPDAISTSYIERQNLTMRMSMRRMTRLTNAFSKKVENLSAAVALHFMWYNFGRVHKTLGNKTPAMAAGVSGHVWKPVEIARLLD
jgi:hypothetical protein